MLGLIYSACTAIVFGITMLTKTLLYIIHKNYEFVTMIIEYVTHFVTAVIFVYSHCREFIVIITTYTVNLSHEIYTILSTVFAGLWKVLTSSYRFLQFCYTHIACVCVSCVNFASTSYIFLTSTAVDIHDSLAMFFDTSVRVAVAAVSSLVVTVTTIGSCCIYFITGVWHGLGFVLSSVASFPTYFAQSIKNVWVRAVEPLTNIVTLTTKETYLGIIVLCILYLTLSNTLRYLYSRGLSLFPRRFRSRRARENIPNWQFDRGFESDFEDMYTTDTENVSWLTRTDDDDDNDNTDAEDDTTEGDSNGDNESSNSDNISDADGGSDSEEYTVVTEESDSEASINSQAFSTESSDHEIEVQLPPVDKCYSLCSRSSTPSRGSKTVNSLEEFDREMERERDKRKCVVCQDQIKSVLVLPCKHMCMCVLCADQIVRSRTIGRRVCPLCRTRIHTVMNIYV